MTYSVEDLKRDISVKELKKDFYSSCFAARIPAGEYEVSLGLSCFHSSKFENGEWESIEIAIFKGDNWMLPKDLIGLGLKEISKRFDQTVDTSIASYVPLIVVCELINSLRALGQEKEKVVEKVKHKCRRCGIFDDYVEEGGLCYRCC